MFFLLRLNERKNQKNFLGIEIEKTVTTTPFVAKKNRSLQQVNSLETKKRSLRQLSKFNFLAKKRKKKNNNQN